MTSRSLALFTALAASSMLAACGAPDEPGFDFIEEIDRAFVFGTGRIIDLGTVAARQHLGAGWNQSSSVPQQGPAWVWGTGERSSLTFRLRAAEGFTLRLRGRAFDHRPRLPLPRVAVRFNGTVLGRRAVAVEWSDMRFEVPAAAVREGPNLMVLEYEFDAPEAEIPREGSGTWVVAWDEIEIDLPADSLPPRPQVSGEWLGLPPGARVQYWVPVETAAELRIDDGDDVAPGASAEGGLRVGIELEGDAPPVDLDLSDPGAAWPVRLELPVRRPGFAVVEMSYFPPAGEDGVAWLRRPRIVDAASGAPAPAEADLAGVNGETASSGGDASAPEPACPGCDVVLVSIDTLRADRLGAYGYERGLTPHLDAFRAEALLFERHIAQAASTLPSHASMFTALVPQRHGASVGLQRPLAPGLATLTELLDGAGYTAAAFTDGGQVDRLWGFGEGFETYVTDAGGEDRETPRFAQTLRLAADWLAGRDGAPLFLFLHTFQMHDPYTPYAADLERVAAARPRHPDIEEMANLIDAYDAEVVDVDRAFGELVAMLQARGTYDTTVLIVTSDHGEELGDHGGTLHSHTLYEELLHVPLIVKLGEGLRAGDSFAGTSSGVDLMPTILDLVGVGARPVDLDGSSLVRRRRPRDTVVVSELDTRNPRGGPSSVRTERWKLLASTVQLRDLRNDAAERENAAGRYPAVVQGLLRHLETVRRPPPHADSIELTEEVEDALRRLGYIR